MASLGDAARRRLQLNPLTTSLNVGQQGYLQTPNSALSSTSLSAPFGGGYNPTVAYTPVSAVRQYNPQQWSSSPSVTSSAEAGGFQVNRPHDSEGVTPAPPPYSPPRSQRTSAIITEEQASSISPATRASPQLYRSSPEPGSNPVFPPPPSTRTRSGSSDRLPSLFSLSSFSRRPAPAPATPEAARPSPDVIRETVLRPRPLPIAVDAPLSSEEEAPQQQFESRPPASRRAASAGAISTPSSSRSRGSSTTRWQPGMPLPPPPPGPPPAEPSSRSQSMTRTDRVVSPPTRRPGQMSSLGPVPPTPAGWVDEDVAGRGRSPNRGLTIDTSSISSNSVTESNSGSSASASGGGLARARAVRGEPKSIRERRTESKARQGGVAATPDEPSNNPWAEAITPADIVVPSTVLGRRPTITRSTPRSGRALAETPKSANDSLRNTPIHSAHSIHSARGLETGSRDSTPRPTPLMSANRPEAPTPPFSPGQLKDAFSNNNMNGSPVIPPKTLPTPPPQSRLGLGSPNGRPISHILHTPNNDAAIIAPLVPSRPGSRASQMSQISPAEQFAQACIKRHQEFAQKEAAATSDSERVRMFADFIVNESRLRRDRYASAIDDMGSEILELTRDLFRPSKTSRRESNVSRSSAWTPDSSLASGPQSPGIPGMRNHRHSMMAAISTELPPSAPASGSGQNSPAGRPESTWWTGYMPSLSPIPSMSQRSEAPDGSDSRGRPSSRWWEVSQGSDGTPAMRLERSKRESKYMGMPRELREALQYENMDTPHAPKEMSHAGPSNQKSYGANEYPPEKVGWHEERNESPMPTDKSFTPPPLFSPPLMTPNKSHLDVSRLITLPPPYPRHHPGVNNNHPELTSIRTLVRVLSDFAEVEKTKSRFLTNATSNQESLKEEAAKRRNSLRIDIQRSINDGTMSYADAAAVEAEAQKVAAEKEKEAMKTDYDSFQTDVVIPLNDLLQDRIVRCTSLFEQLQKQLFVDAQESSPNIPQEEGDEQPELLEKLTLLKWIFETREQLHREVYDILTDRNSRYKECVLTPYRRANNTVKIVNVEKFFKDDEAKRALEFEQGVLKRTEECGDIIESNVVRGVEVQLSAFWDIAPSLAAIISKIPLDLEGFHVQIPKQELDENPAYWDHPMQYLNSLLDHCEKSTYQFIESQTNLLCLLHEVKVGVTKGNCRLIWCQRIGQGEDKVEVEGELSGMEGEERRLTDDLKEKVRCVEELWGSALGEEMKGVRGRIKEWLLQRGGWCEDEE